MEEQEQSKNASPEQILKPNSNLSTGTEPSSIELPQGLQAGLGLAVASLVFGVVSLSLSIFAIGAAAGLIGLILAIVHLCRKLPLRAIALWGLVLSALGTTIGAGFAVWYGVNIYRTYSMVENWADESFVEYIGQTAPDVNLIDLDGNKITLSELKGKRVVLDFWATWCPPCKKEIPHFIKLRQTIDSEELVIIGISNEPVEVIKTFAEKHHINYPLVSVPNDDIPEPYSNIMSIPTTFFIDREGAIENVLSGYHSFEVLKDNAVGNKAKIEEPYPNMSSSEDASDP